MLELQRLLDAGHDVTFQHGDGTAADGSRSHECCRITPEGNGVNAQLCDILLIAHQHAERAELSQGDAPKPRHLHAKRGGDRATAGQPHQACSTLGGAGTKPVGRPPVLGHAGGRRDPLPDHSAPMPNHLGGAGSEPSVEHYVDGLDGAERKVLLNHIAQAWPEVVEAGVELVAQWRAECAERRYAADKRKAKERRRRQRANALRAELGG
jgi:hypothetical protein